MSGSTATVEFGEEVSCSGASLETRLDAEPELDDDTQSNKNSIAAAPNNVARRVMDSSFGLRAMIPELNGSRCFMATSGKLNNCRAKQFSALDVAWKSRDFLFHCGDMQFKGIRVP